jgi:PadR family transcriptional regulator, regulatory protein PadR
MAMKDLIGASAEVLILGVVAREPSYGYQIIRRVNDESDGLFAWQEGTIYPLLHKLDKGGFVRPQWQDADTGRQRKYYYITAAGRERLKVGAKEWAAVNKLLVRLAGVSNV